MRVLVTLSPQMYREAIALSIQNHRPDLEVRIAPPDATEGELARFRPYLLVYNDTAPMPKEALTGVLATVEMLYSNSMDARVTANGVVSKIRDMSTADLLRTLAVAASVASRD